MIAFIIRNSSGEKIIAALDAKEPFWKRIKDYTHFYGIITTAAFLFGIFGFIWQQSTALPSIDRDKVIDNILQRMENAGPGERERLKELLDTLVNGIKKETAVDTEEQSEALKALEKGNISKAKKLFETLINTSNERQAKNYYYLGITHYFDLKYKDALSAYLEAEKLDPGNALYLNEVGFVYHKLADYKKAISYYEKSLAVDLKTYGPEHPKVATLWNNLGSAWHSLGDYPKAIEYAQKAIPILEKFLGPDHPNTKTVKDNLEYFKSKLKEKKSSQ